MKEKIWLSPPHMSGNEMKYIQEAFDSNWIAPTGPNVDAFEQELCDYTGCKYAVALSSGTAAIHLALISLGVRKGDIVLCQSLTFAASANPIVYLGAVPAFIDSEAQSWNMCPDSLETGIKHFIRIQKKPKAIIVVHLYGMPARLNEICSLCEKYGIPLIEDAAEALGSQYFGKKAGTFGDIGILSFNGNKIITTSGGGALLSNNKNYTDKALFLATQARDPAFHYEHSEIGYNYRLSNICAGIGRGQLEVINTRVAARRSNFDLYKKHLSTTPGLHFQKEWEGVQSNRWLTSVIIEPEIAGISSQTICTLLISNEIECRPIWKPMHMQPAFSSFPYFGKKISENLYRNGLCLPSGSSLSAANISEICFFILDLHKKSRPYQGRLQT